MTNSKESNLNTLRNLNPTGRVDLILAESFPTSSGMGRREPRESEELSVAKGSGPQVLLSPDQIWSRMDCGGLREGGGGGRS